MASNGKQGSYGLKEVADVRFYKIEDVQTSGGAISKPSFYTDANGATYYGYASSTTAAYLFDSLKVSNIEISSEDVSARGGKGNPELISWSYGKEVTLTIEDALFNLQTLHLLFGAKEGANGAAIADSATEITIDANSFPGTYAICGSTVMRSYATLNDEPFGFIIPKGKVNANGTLTMEAEGDPSTFEMTIKAMSATLDTTKDVLIKFEKQAQS